MIRSLVIGLLAMAAGVQAQPRGGGPPPNWRFVGAEAGRPGSVVKNAPFSADVTTETTVTLSDGNRIRQTSSSRLYRDGEGRTRREQSLNSLGGLTSNANLPPVVFINDPVAGVNYAISPSSRSFTKSTSPGGRGGRPMRGRPEGAGLPNVKTESLGRQTIEGIPAEGTRTTITIPAGQMGNELPLQTVTETWYSPDLQAPLLSKRSDPRNGESVTRYTNISRGEPARTLFDVPADYKLMDPAGRGPRGASR